MRQPRVDPGRRDLRDRDLRAGPGPGAEPGGDAGAPAWHALDPPEVERLLATGPGGLPEAEVSRRLEIHGENRLAEQPPDHPLVVLLRQFTSPLIYILVGATVVTILLDELLDAAVIAVVLVLNATIGFVQERRAEGAVRALQKLVVPTAHVVRGGEEQVVDSRTLVPGDVVVLEPGSSVPADVRLVAAQGLQIDESLLTGESVPVTKRTAAIGPGATLADRACLAFTGALVTSGRGRGVVVATGQATALGAIAGLMRDEEEVETPLQQRMNHLARTIGIIVGISSVVAFTSGVALGGDVGDMFLTAVALAVAAVPEGLPVAFTITLALGVHRMARRNAIIRRLAAVETLGSTTVIGSDKTGTLTQNRMTVQEIWTPGGSFELDAPGDEDADGPRRSLDAGSHLGLRHTLVTAVLANEADLRQTTGEPQATGDPTEIALLVAAGRAGLDPATLRAEHPVVAEIPFEPDLRYAAAVVSDGDLHEVHVKGAPERVLTMCDSMLGHEGTVPVDPEVVHEAARSLAAKGQRVLAMASGPTDPPENGTVPEPSGLVLTGLQGMLDPPRPGVREAVAGCQDAGIRVVMITGDHAITARAIAADLGIAEPDAPVLTGAHLAELDDGDLAGECASVRIFARIPPDGKLRIVRALQSAGEVVAVTGDGVNDAPALRAAAIGVAMGRDGTDVAREAADMVLSDDDFVSIVAAVEEGRITFDNIRKVTFFLISTGAATIIAILAALWLGWPLLMLPAQLLWLNLVTNGLQDVALAFEPGEDGVLRRPPRARREGIISRLLWQRTVLVGVLMAVGTLALFRWELDGGASLARAQTVALTTMVVFMAFHAGNARSEHRSLLTILPWSNPFLFAATIAALTIHVAALYLPPTQFVLRVEPLDLAAWGRSVAVAASILVVVELDKAIRRRLAGARPAASEAPEPPSERVPEDRDHRP